MGRRRSKPKVRKTHNRAIGTVFAIAAEGRATEKKYFDSLNRVLEGCTVTYASRKWNRTEPMQVLNDLIAHRQKEIRGRKKSDQYWLVIDHDDTDKAELARVWAKAAQNDCFVADSKPCFELWLLMHFNPLNSYQRIEASGDNSPCAPAERLLEVEDNSYKRHKKGKYKSDEYMGGIADAISHAKLADNDPPNQPLAHVGTRVYNLLEKIRAANSSSPHNPLN